MKALWGWEAGHFTKICLVPWVLAQRVKQQSWNETEELYFEKWESEVLKFSLLSALLPGSFLKYTHWSLEFWQWDEWGRKYREALCVLLKIKTEMEGRPQSVGLLHYWGWCLLSFYKLNLVFLAWHQGAAIQHLIYLMFSNPIGAPVFFTQNWWLLRMRFKIEL